MNLESLKSLLLELEQDECLAIEGGGKGSQSNAGSFHTPSGGGPVFAGWTTAGC